MAIKILLVEDDAAIAEIITDYFTDKSTDQIKITVAANGEDANFAYLENEFDLILLDIMLPDVDGFTICRTFRKNSDIPIIFITAKHNEEDKLYGYQLGADDYVTKPFSLAELYAKTIALLNRSKGMVRSKSMVVGNIKMDPFRYQVLVSNREVNLTPKEFAVLKVLMNNSGQVISREQLLTRVWGYDFEGSNRVVDNQIKKLRKTLGLASSQIKTVFKKGYRLEEV